jgi:DNA-binding transcriptional LysR family regulator
LQIHLDASDGFVNLVESGYDMAIRFGALADSNLIVRQLAPNVRVICAAPAYLKRHGRPDAIEGLLKHDCIIYGNPPMDHWRFANGSSVRVKGTLSTNDGDIAHAWALQGAGLVLKSIWDVDQDIRAGRLEVVLPSLRLPAAPINAVYPHRRHTAAKVRLCIDFLAQKLMQQRVGDIGN